MLTHQAHRLRSIIFNSAFPLKVHAFNLCFQLKAYACTPNPPFAKHKLSIQLFIPLHWAILIFQCQWIGSQQDWFKLISVPQPKSLNQSFYLDFIEWWGHKRLQICVPILCSPWAYKTLVTEAKSGDEKCWIGLPLSLLQPVWKESDNWQINLTMSIPKEAVNTNFIHIYCYLCFVIRCKRIKPSTNAVCFCSQSDR